MNKYQIRAIAGGPAAAVAKASGCATLLRALAVVLVMLTLASSAVWAQGLPLRTCPGGTQAYLCRGEIILADANSGPPPSMGALFLIDPSTGAQTVISSGNLLNETVGVVVEPNGMLVASDRNTGIIRVDPSTGLQTVLSPAAPLNDFFGIVRESSGDFIVTDSGLNSDKIGLTAPGIQGRVLRINKTTGAQTTL